jgi:hypothetical protein
VKAERGGVLGASRGLMTKGTAHPNQVSAVKRNLSLVKQSKHGESCPQLFPRLGEEATTALQESIATLTFSSHRS